MRIVIFGAASAFVLSACASTRAERNNKVAKTDVDKPITSRAITPPHMVTEKRRIDPVNALVAKGAELDTEITKGYYTTGFTQLHLAAEDGDKVTVEALIKAAQQSGRLKSLLESKNDHGQTPLHWAARNGQEATVEALLQAGADVKAPDNNGCTPLHWAILSRATEPVKALIDAGAKVDAPVTDGEFKGCTPRDLTNNNAIKALLRNAGERT